MESFSFYLWDGVQNRCFFTKREYLVHYKDIRFHYALFLIYALIPKSFEEFFLYFQIFYVRKRFIKKYKTILFQNILRQRQIEKNPQGWERKYLEGSVFLFPCLGVDGGTMDRGIIFVSWF